MTLDAFVGTFIFTFLLVFAINISIRGIIGLFPNDRAGIKIDFKNHD